MLLKKRELEESGIGINTYVLRNYNLGIDGSDKTILTIFKEHNDKCEGLINKYFAPGTVARYKTCNTHVSNFYKTKYKRNEVMRDNSVPELIHLLASLSVRNTGMRGLPI